MGLDRGSTSAEGVRRGAPARRRLLASMLLAAAPLLAACMTDGDRGHAFTRTSLYEPQGIDPWRQGSPHARAFLGTRAERDETATLTALARAVLETQRNAGKMALERLSSEPLREHAAAVVQGAEEDLDALHALAVARGLDVATAAASAEPMFAAQRQTAEHELARLRSLSGTAFARAWLAGEQQRLELLASIASLSVRLSPDVVAGNVFRKIAHDARTQSDRAVALSETAANG